MKRIVDPRGMFRRYGVVLALAALPLLGVACSDDTEGNGNNGGFQIGDDMDLVADPDTVTFSGVAAGDEVTQTITLKHTGTRGVLQMRNVQLVDASSELTITQPLLMELQPQETTTMTVTYRPTDDTLDSGKITIGTNAPLPGGGTLVREIPISTLAPYVQFVASPSVVDFGAVEGGKTATKTLNITNIGTLAVTITDVDVQPGGSQDFGVAVMPELKSYGRDESFSMDLTYTPTLGDVDSGKLRVFYEADGEEGQFDVLLKGQEVSPRLVVFPPLVDFGKRDPLVKHTLPVSLANQGSLALEISSVTVEPTGEWSDSVGVEGFPAEGLTLDDATPASIDVTFTPPADMPTTTNPIANLRIASNDPAGGGVTLIPVFGSPQAPTLQVNPPELVDFGFVAQNLTTTRKVTLFNAGTADLTVTFVELVDDTGATPGEYAIKNADLWGPTATSPTSAIIPGDEHQEVRVTFTNNGGASGTAWGKLIISSDDPQQPTWEVTLKAQRAGAPSCEVQLVPDQVDYGIVPRGFTKTLTFNLNVVGSGECGFHSAFVNDCDSWLGFFGGSCPDPTATLAIDGNSDVYQVTEKPFSAANNLKPGQSYPIKVTFTPPDSAPLFGDENTDFAGLLAVRVTNPYTGGSTPDILVYPGPTGANYTPNLHAKTGIAELSVFPGELDFGLTTIGCHSQTLTLNAYNIGSAPLDITDWELVGCSPEFEVKEYPALSEPDGNGGFKKTLNPDEGVEFKVVYVPQDEGADECSLAIYTNASDTPAAVVPINGEGTFETEHTDEYVQTSGQDVDVLFVVDNSGSMSEEQSNLSKNFGNFINEASTWNNDYHVGVVTTDIEGDGGLLKGTPRYVTNQNWNAFANNVKVGTSGSGTEKGLMAAQMALSLPLSANSSIACTTDADCTAPEGCVDGYCGGFNRGFMRKDAALEIVFVSDEEDQSPADLNFYTNFFKNLKGFYNSNLMHVHAIVGPTGGCSSSAGDAVAGHRYMDLAQATGGNTVSICEPDFASGLKSIGEIAFGLKVQFFLTRVPDPSTIEVKVNDVACAASGGNNWLYDAPSNSVVFNENGGCMPQPGEDVWIHYETICFLE